jgi:hypothetical protein
MFYLGLRYLLFYFNEQRQLLYAYEFMSECGQCVANADFPSALHTGIIGAVVSAPALARYGPAARFLVHGFQTDTVRCDTGAPPTFVDSTSATELV